MVISERGLSWVKMAFAKVRWMLARISCTRLSRNQHAFPKSHVGEEVVLVIPCATLPLHPTERGEGNLHRNHSAVHELFAAHRRLRRTGHGADDFGVPLFDVGRAVGGERLGGELRAESPEFVPAPAIDAETFGGEDFVAGLDGRGEIKAVRRRGARGRGTMVIWRWGGGGSWWWWGSAARGFVVVRVAREVGFLDDVHREILDVKARGLVSISHVRD